MLHQDDDDYGTDDQYDDAPQSDDGDTQGAHQAIAGAAPEEVDAHRDMLSRVMQTLQGQGVDTAALAGQAGASTDDPSAMSHGDLVSTTLALAREHPEVMQTVSQQFPEAQGLLGSVLGSGESGGGGLGSLLGGFLGGH